MRSRWVRWGLWSGGGALVSLIALWLLTGVREIHRTDLPVNFPLAAPQPGDEDWPWWLGPRQDGFVTRSQPPVRWSPSENTAWLTPLPGTGLGSPIVWNGRVFLTAADEARSALLLVCLDRQTGQQVWQTEIHRGPSSQISARRWLAIATPACDGERVYVTSQQAGMLAVTAVDLTGKIAWKREAGPYASAWGHAASPVISGSLVIVSADQKSQTADRLRGASFLAALHRQTGEIIWRVARPAGESYATPIVARIAGRQQLVLPGRTGVTAYDPASGAMLWTCRWMADRPVGNVAYDANCVYASIRYPLEYVLCIRADGSGDVTKTHVVWQERRSASDVPAPLVCDDDLLILADEGLLTCLEKATGRVLWKKRLSGKFSASPVAISQYVYCVNEAGTVFVVDRLARGEVVAENLIGQGCLAPPAITGSSLLFRSARGVLLVQSPSNIPYVDVPPLERRRM